MFESSPFKAEGSREDHKLFSFPILF